MQKRMTVGWGLACVVLILVLPTTALAETGPKKGEMPPEIIGESTTGVFFKLSAGNPKPRLINFFTFSCKYCKKEIPQLADLARKNPWVEVICVNAEFQPKNKVNAFIQSLPDAPETIICGNALLPKAYGIKGFPYTFFVDENNIFVDSQSGTVEPLLKRLEKINPSWRFKE